MAKKTDNKTKKNKAVKKTAPVKKAKKLKAGAIIQNSEEVPFVEVKNTEEVQTTSTDNTPVENPTPTPEVKTEVKPEQKQEVATQHTGVSNSPSDKTETPNPNTTRLEFGDEIRKILATAGTLKLTKEEDEILLGKIKDEDVYIKPDGLVYITWFKFAERLSKAFSATGWSMIPEGMPKMFENNVVWGFHLVIKGCYCGTAIGEQQYFPANKRMTYGEACEGAKSNALMRLCKGLGMGLELWDKAFTNRWLNAHATYSVEIDRGNGRDKQVWRLKDGAFGIEALNVEVTKKPQKEPLNTNPDQRNNLNNTPNSNTNGNTNNNPNDTIGGNTGRVVAIQENLNKCTTQETLKAEYSKIQARYEPESFTKSEIAVLRKTANDKYLELNPVKK